MTFLIGAMGPWLAGAFGIGLVAGVFGGRADPRAGMDGARLALLVAIALGLAASAVSMAGGLSGQAAVWLDIAILMAGAYAAGTVAGFALGRIGSGARQAPAVASDAGPEAEPVAAVKPTAAPEAPPMPVAEPDNVPAASDPTPAPAASGNPKPARRPSTRKAKVAAAAEEPAAPKRRKPKSAPP